MVADCGLTPDGFWELSMYEWSLYLHRHKVQSQKRYNQEKTFWQGVAVLWSVLMNGLMTPKKGSQRKIYTPDDLVKFEGELKEEQIEEEDLVARVKRKHGATV